MTLGQKNANAAKLPTEGNDPQDGDLFLSGWGTLHSGDTTIPADLQKVTVPLTNRSVCAKAYTGIVIITKNMFCAGKLGVGGVDSCQG